MNCEIVRGGIIRPGDHVRGVAGSYEPKRCEDGGKGDTFYVRPKLRTVAQVKAGKIGLAALHERLLQTDPQGVARVQAACALPGLQPCTLARAARLPLPCTPGPSCSSPPALYPWAELLVSPCPVPLARAARPTPCPVPLAPLWLTRSEARAPR